MNLAESSATPLTVRRVAIDTWRENVAYLRRDCPVVRAEGFQALAKVEVAANGQSILAVLNVVDDRELLGDCELGLSEEAFHRLGIDDGSPVRIAHAEPPASLGALRRRIGGQRLSQRDLELIVGDIAARRYSHIELAAFLVATSQVELDRDEVLWLTQAMAAVGQKLDWRGLDGDGLGTHLVVDKHCIGGLPGNRTSMIVVPIVAVHAETAGLLIPKTSSRAITSPAGTADTMECLARVELSLDEMRAVVRAEHGCLAWGGRAALSPADDVLISVSRPLSLDAPAQMVASILSKKLAAGSTHLVLDIPLGPTAKVRSRADADKLAGLFEDVGAKLGLTIVTLITDGAQPVGRGIGPLLEARDVMQVLHGDPAAPADLREKSLLLAGRVIEFDPGVPAGQGIARARAILDSGAALAKMNAIIDAQGRQAFDWRAPPLGALTHVVAAEADGRITAIDCERIARIARLAGAPKARGAGVDLLARLGDSVARGAPLYRVHATSSAELAFALQVAGRGSAFRVGPAAAARTSN
jgi:thymidine phosphorylase